MAGINKAILVGRVGADPEIARLNSGDSVAEFSLATSQAWRDKNSGERKEKTQWHRIKIFNQNAVKVAEQYVKKGDQVGVEGEIQYREWEKDGVKRIATEIVVGAFDGKLHLLGSKNDNNGGNSGGSRPSGGGQQQNRQSSQQSNQNNRDLDDEIPF